MYAGYEQVVWQRYTPSPNCSGAGAQNADITAFATVVFPPAFSEDPNLPPTASTVCLTKLATPLLQIIYF